MRAHDGGRRSRSPGFTLIELMIVVAIIGILAAIAIPKFADLIRKSNEGSSKGNLGSIRSAVSVYYSDMEGQYPGELSSMTVAGKYLANVPNAKYPSYHVDTSTPFEPTTPGSDDAGGWTYDNVPNDQNLGTVWVNCTHTDTKGTTWSSY